MRPVALLTDFGIDDPFVGSMRAVIARLAPGVGVFDLTHGIAPQAVADGAFWLGASLPYLPLDVVCVCVVDPGVGTARAPLAVRVEDQLFLGPDNGLLTAIADVGEARRIDVGRHALPKLSATFHGRDLFAPVAARLATGALAFDDVGPQVDTATLVRVPAPAENCVLLFDRFGNAFTSAREERDVMCAGQHFRFVRTYGDGAEAEPLALRNAFGVIELAVRNGNARERFGLKRGDRVSVVG